MAQNGDVEAGFEVSRRVVLLGCSGSIGTQTVQVVDAAAGRFSICAIAAAGSDVAALAAQAAYLQVEAVAVAREQAREPLVAALAALIPDPARRPLVSSGPQAVAELARYDADIVLNAVAGDQGLRATVAALESGTTVALANKESLIAGGRLVTSMAKPGQLIPVDSEHSAMAQCLRSGGADEVRKLILTASGGPFRGRTREQLRDVTPAQALAHPTWNMGTLVTTNSATLVNKGLELIEAHLLFEVALERIQAVVHPQSIVHSMVEFYDGSTIAQASPPDMKLPIALALGWPQRVPEAAAALDWSRASSWSFEPVDNEAFPAIELARQAGIAGGCAPAVYNAANEECVAAFHSLRLDFLGIVDTVEKVLSEHMSREPQGLVPASVDEIESVQLWARTRVRELLGDR